ncbi:ExeM/NucH family extracellular endonuclease [Saccharospirillum mangrovi]|uniref:ExeM/NucH family extracellular endonuclease n=1 Tax=Saccharospirillum mangrovi TaxID=2161747 RepID=UPI0013B421E6|nr:ExeM/NucH family extracellular endonuclease [Saccharospirillum mangrovi]
MKTQLPILALTTVLVSTAAQADLIFSEYIEGSSNNKALELTNTGASAVDLSEYRIELYSNGNLNVQSGLNLSGTLAASDDYVIANSNAVSAILDVADITSAVTNFNGNDALVLKHNGVVVDRIGQVGNADYYGGEVTLVRKAGITQGDPQYDTAFDPAEQWDSYPQNTFAYLGDAGTDNGDGGDPTLAQCGDAMTLISAIQGSGSSSPLIGQSVAIEAIVVAELQGSNEMSGFFVQEENADADGDASTSEGLFIYASTPMVSVGDKVVVNGQVDEYFGLTQLNQIAGIEICASGQTLPSAAGLSLPLAELNDLEAVEGMRVSFNQILTVNEVYQLGRYGEFMIGNGRRYIPTEVAAPGAPAIAVAEANALNALLVEDGISSQNPDPLIFPAPGLSAYNSLRIGDTLPGLTGVLNYGFGAYKVIPTVTPTFLGTNPRTLEPTATVGANLRLASFNVLNYFNGDGLGGGFPTDRGAETPLELERQQAKLIAALEALDADVIGLMEIENDGFGATSAIAQLTEALNATQIPGEEYDFVAPGVSQIGTDAIAVGLLYRPEVVSPVNMARILDSSNSPLDDEGEPLFIDDLNRPALAQSFEHAASGDRFTVVVNHFKSKGNGNCADFDDCESSDLQGAYNGARTAAAQAMVAWLAGNPTGVADADVLIMGDLNAYSMEDPVQTLADGGYHSLKANGEYSYVFDGASGNLDHALASASLAAKVLDVQDWHINTDEPLALDYNTNFKSAGQIESFYAPTPYRSSDHDPVVIDLAMNAPPVAHFKVYKILFWYLFISDSHDPDGYLTAQDWRIGNLTFSGDWKLLSVSQVKRQHSRDVTLTVTDNDGATDSRTKRL